MTTLKGKNLIDYLGNLKTKIRNYENPELYESLLELVEVEENFYDSIPEEGRVLAFSGNGLFSIDSLEADLKSMYQMDDFKEISESYKRGIKDFDNEKYKKVSKSKWSNERKKYDNLIIKKGFEFRETKNDKFELKTREEFYLNGIDNYSQKYPMMIRDRKIKSFVAFDNLFTDVEESFSLLKTTKDMIKKENSLLDKLRSNENLQVIAKMGMGTFKVIEWLIHSTCFFPTHVRRGLDICGDDESWILWGGFFGFASTFLYELSIFDNFDKGHRLLALLPVITHGLSGLYETFRYLKERM